MAGSACVVETPLALPHSCGMCGYGGSDRKWWIDTTKQFEYYGAFYICDQCFTFLASLVNFVPPDISERILEENMRLVALVQDRERKIEMLTNAIKNLESADVTVVSVDSDLASQSDLADAVQRGLLPNGETTSEESRTGESDVASEPGTTPEPLHDNPLAGLRSDESSDFDFGFK